MSMWQRLRHAQSERRFKASVIQVPLVPSLSKDRSETVRP